MMLNSKQVGMNNFCFICKEPNKISMKASTLKNINQQLIRVVKSSNYDLSKINSREINRDLKPGVTKTLTILKNDIPSAKCRYNMNCSKMNSELLRREFLELYNTFEKVVYVLLKTTNESEFNEIKGSTLRLFQGHLPKFYTVLTREIIFNKENL